MLRETTEGETIELRKTSLGAITTLFYCKPAPPFECISLVFPVIIELAKSHGMIVFDVCHALTCFLEVLVLPARFQYDICKTAVYFLSHPETAIQVLALQLLLEFTSSESDSQTEMVIHCGALPALKMLLETSTSEKIKLNVCLNIGNILSSFQVEAVINAGLIESLLATLEDESLGIQNEAAWAIACSTNHSNANETQIQQLVDKGCVEKMCSKITTCHDVKMLAFLLGFIKYVIREGERLKSSRSDNRNPYVMPIEETETSRKIARRCKIDFKRNNGN